MCFERLHCTDGETDAKDASTDDELIQHFPTASAAANILKAAAEMAALLVDARSNRRGLRAGRGPE